MKIIKLNEEFNLVRFNTGEEVVRFIKGNPYAPENIEIAMLLGPPLDGITEEELALARASLDRDEGAECIGPYVIK